MLTAQTIPTDAQQGKEFATQIAERVRQAREERAITQDQFAAALGCNDRQTISAIETGIRRIAPEEMVRIAKILSKPVSFFTDPYVIAETSAFSYRAAPNSPDIGAFERKAHKLISASRRFRRLLGEPEAPFGNQLKGINRQTPLLAAADAGDRTAGSLGLGDTPALKLLRAAEERLSVSILFVDAPESISGAVCHLPDGDYVLVNRNEASFRRNFNIGHELFHVLTWAEMPPGRIDPVLQGEQRPKVERLADNFSSGLLMPLREVQGRWRARAPEGDLHRWIIANAKDFRVSGQALYWRLVDAGLLSKTVRVDLRLLSRSDEDDGAGKPNPYSAEFARRLSAVLDRGLVSVRKAADLLECEPHDLKGIVSAYGFNPSRSRLPWAGIQTPTRSRPSRNTSSPRRPRIWRSPCGSRPPACETC